MRIRSGRRGAHVLAALAALFVLGPAVIVHAEDDPASLEERHLPTAVNAPGTWSGDEEVRWPVAAVGVATRTEPVGLVEKRESLALFAVSALDGHAAWLRTPGLSLDGWGFGGFAVSPDGQWIGWVRPHRPQGPSYPGRVAGWSIMETTTGAIRELDVPGVPWVKGTMTELAFSGDSRYLLTSYESPGTRNAPQPGSHQLVAWDTEDGKPTVIEEPGPSWLPNLGSAPTGVTWARGRNVFRVDPASGDMTTVTLPQDVIAASWGPDDTSFAYIGRTAGKPKSRWRLYAGRTFAEARGRAVDLPSGVGVDQLLGWRDPVHVVLGHFRTSVHVVDVVTGAVEKIDLKGDGTQVNAPYLASDLWEQPLVVPEEPEEVADPRRPWWWLSGTLLVLLAGVLLSRRWRRTTDQPAELTRPPWEPARPGEQAQVEPGDGGSTADSRPWRPLATAATGMLLVLLDFRVGGSPDLIPDPLGWVIAALALGSLAEVHPGFRLAGVAAWVAAVPSVPEWFGVESTLIDVSVGLALLVVQVATCTALMSVSPARRPSASTIRWLAVGLDIAQVLAIAGASAEPSAAVLGFTLGLASLGVLAWFLVLLYGASKDVPRTGAPRQLAVRR
ncbi:hypothetical protein [Nocardioides campestrisoli]|uniref:hypothetical protein n=1 Tax=Nocardioides campestrisoli TaxID=2736757 RepID=UPI00163DAA09|nr:hypothetical protein [Nocardioides campestrisoli]